jgi:putative ABC transport system substrate-binding protein
LAATPAYAQRPIAHASIGWLAHGDTMPRHFFDEALARLGWVEGANLTIERRFGGSAGDQESKAAADLVASHPDVIVAMGTVDARPILSLTSAIPIVVVTAADPVGQGLAASLARPGGNLTGTVFPTLELLPKQLEIAHDLFPAAKRLSVLANPKVHSDPPASLGAAFGVALITRHAGRSDELEQVYAAAAADLDNAMVVQLSPLTFEERAHVTELASKYRMPSVYASREYVESGGLISYGPVIRYNFERAAVLVDKILRGAKPGDLPFEQPTHFEMLLNRTVASTLGLTIPPSLLARADEVIE